MSSLKNIHPEVYEAFKNGFFPVQITRTSPLGCLPIDQALEVTVNRDTQTPGGTNRFSLKSGAVKSYYITSEHRSAFLGHLRHMVQGNVIESLHHDHQQTRTEKDEEAVSIIVNLINS